MLAGAAIGLPFPGQGPDTPGIDCADLKILSDLFVHGITVVTGPTLLVIGIAGHGSDLKKVRRFAFRSLLYVEVVTTIALIVGLTAVNLIRPGDDPALRAALRADEAQAPAIALAEPMGWRGHVHNVVPTSAFDALATNNVLQIVLSSILFGVALSQVPGIPREAFLAFVEGLAETMFQACRARDAARPDRRRRRPHGDGRAQRARRAEAAPAARRDALRSLLVFALVAPLPIALVARIPIVRFLK